MTWRLAQRKSTVTSALFAIPCVLFLGALLASAGQTRRPARPAPKPATKQPQRNAIVPFDTGERLSFRVIWSKFSVNAATIELSVVERRDFFGRPAWHFRALAQTIDTMRVIFPLEDQLDSYTDALRAQLASIRDVSARAGQAAE